MEYRSVAEMAELWGISERTVRNYCAERRIEGAVLIGKTWKIPADAVRPGRRKLKRPETLLEVLREQKSSNQHGGIYHKLQIELTYNSNHIEGSKLTHDQTRYIFETLDGSWRPYGARDHEAAAQMASYLANFARCGDPNGPGLPRWEKAKKGVLRIAPRGTKMGHVNYLKLTRNFIRRPDPKA